MKTFVIATAILHGLVWPSAFNPLPITWKQLTDVQFTRKLNKEVSMYFLYPTFGPSVKALEGKEIQIKGYLIPVDDEANLYVISAQPMAMCFFCGGSGPESLIELEMKNKKTKFRTDEVRTVRGTLRLNPSDIAHLNYILKDVQVVK